MNKASASEDESAIKVQRNLLYLGGFVRGGVHNREIARNLESYNLIQKSIPFW